MSTDGGPPSDAVIGQPHPGVAEAYPRYEGVDQPGFGFRLPALAPGPHTVTVTLVAKDGAKGRSVEKDRREMSPAAHQSFHSQSVTSRRSPSFFQRPGSRLRKPSISKEKSRA